MVKNVIGKQIWSVADPLQKETQINLGIKDLKSGKSKKIQAQLPQKELAGSTVTL